MQQAAKQRPSYFPIGNGSRSLASSRCERSLAGLFAGMFLALMHLFDEGLGLLFVDKGQAGGTDFELECMKEGSILVVSEVVIDLLIPDHAPASGLHRTMHCQHFYSFLQHQYGPPTETSTILSQKVLPTRSLQRTAAP